MHLVKLKGTTIIIFLTVKEKFANLRTTVIKKNLKIHLSVRTCDIHFLGFISLCWNSLLLFNGRFTSSVNLTG